jgi:hypothetical protein
MGVECPQHLDAHSPATEALPPGPPTAKGKMATATSKPLIGEYQPAHTHTECVPTPAPLQTARHHQMSDSFTNQTVPLCVRSTLNAPLPTGRRPPQRPTAVPPTSTQRRRTVEHLHPDIWNGHPQDLLPKTGTVCHRVVPSHSRRLVTQVDHKSPAACDKACQAARTAATTRAPADKVALQPQGGRPVGRPPASPPSASTVESQYSRRLRDLERTVTTVVTPPAARRPQGPKELCVAYPKSTRTALQANSQSEDHQLQPHNARRSTQGCKRRAVPPWAPAQEADRPQGRARAAWAGKMPVAHLPRRS